MNPIWNDFQLIIIIIIIIIRDMSMQCTLCMNELFFFLIF